MLRMEYSESRGTWNVFTEENEWYYEGNFEQCAEMVDRSNAMEYEDDYNDEYPSDYYGE